jgi:hypothetical protein
MDRHLDVSLCPNELSCHFFRFLIPVTTRAFGGGKTGDSVNKVPNGIIGRVATGNSPRTLFQAKLNDHPTCPYLSERERTH